MKACVHYVRRMGRLRRDDQCCGREAQSGRRTKINWTKTAHNTYMHAYTIVRVVTGLALGLKT